MREGEGRPKEAEKEQGLRLEIRSGLEELDPAAWDALAGEDDPFAEHGFLHALEESKSVGDDSGWLPLHVTLWEGAELLGALPLYLKDHSWGEYIFDFGWSRAAQQLGVPYYPKLVSMAPFTPATGRRLLLSPRLDPGEGTGLLIQGARLIAEEVRASSVHLLFLSEEERSRVLEPGVLKHSPLMPRLSLQYHWHNQGYESFEHYLSFFRASARKQVKRERREVAESRLELRTLSGPELSEQDWKAIAFFYRVNCARHGSYPYLTPRWFQEIRARIPERVVAAMAYDGGEPVACSLAFEKGAHLYGRYWGCREDHDFLHFELCYYQLIERAIAKGHRRFEAGAQGRHKIKRGLMPSAIHSAHWLADPRLAGAVRDFLPAEAHAVGREMEELSARGPFKREHER